MNLANKLTVSRIIITFLMIVFPYLSLGKIGNYNISILIFAFLFVLGSITDFLDGYIARKNNLITNFGKFLDPLADKMLVITALLILLDFGKIPVWIVAIILIREFAVSGFRMMEAKNGKVVAASKSGKIKTATQMIGITLAILDPLGFFGFLSVGFSFEYIFNLITSMLILVSTILTITSGWSYLKQGKYILKDM